MFANREEAGRELARHLSKYMGQPNTLIVALARGGIITGYEVAQLLQLPLDLICPRKIGAPHNPELALGACMHTGDSFLNDDIIYELDISPVALKDAIERAKKESAARHSLYRKGRQTLTVQDKTVILVDDGLATGATMKAAIKWARAEKAGRIVVAIPVAPPSTTQEIRQLADEVIVLLQPSSFSAVGQFYTDFRQTEDEEVYRRLNT